jgi:hypothetical protein
MISKAITLTGQRVTKWVDEWKTRYWR